MKKQGVDLWSQEMGGKEQNQVQIWLQIENL